MVEVHDTVNGVPTNTVLPCAGDVMESVPARMVNLADSTLRLFWLLEISTKNEPVSETPYDAARCAMVGMAHDRDPSEAATPLAMVNSSLSTMPSHHSLIVKVPALE